MENFNLLRLQRQNEALKAKLEEAENALKIAELKAKTDSEQIRVLRELNADYSGQIQALKYCIRNGVKL